MMQMQQNPDAPFGEPAPTHTRQMRSYRANKTSQGTRARNGSKPLIPQHLLAAQNINDDQSYDLSANGTVTNGQAKIMSNGAKSGNGVSLVPDPYQDPGITFGMPNHRNLASDPSFPYQQRSYNGLLNDLQRQRKSMKRRRKQSVQNGQVTLFQQTNITTAAGSKGGGASSLMTQDRSSRRLKRSVISNRSRSSSQSSQNGANTPRSKNKKSLNFNRRKKEQNAVSQENMRFVAQLVHVKATVPSGNEIKQRHKQQRQLRKNLTRSFDGRGNEPYNPNESPSRASSRNGMGTPLSTKGHPQRKNTNNSPRILPDTRIKAKALKNFYKIKSTSPEPPHPQKLLDHPSCHTPKYLKPRNFNSKILAQMYEADDNIIFGQAKQDSQGGGKRRKKRTNSDTQSRASSRGGGSSQGSARRRKKKSSSRARGAGGFAFAGGVMYGETGSMQAYKQLDYYQNDHLVASQHGAKNAQTMDIISNQSNHGAAPYLSSSLHNEIISENASHPGPKPNPAGYSLIQKMNNLMTQKTSSKYSEINSRIGDSKSNNIENRAIDEGRETQISSDIDSKQFDLRQNRNDMFQQYQNVMAKHQKKSTSKKQTKSIPRQQGKRKSLNDAFSSHPFAGNVCNPKTTLLQGYYSTATGARTSVKSRQTNRTQSNLPPRAVKTATLRKHDDVGDQYINMSGKRSPNSKQFQQQSRTTNNGTLTGKRRIIVAVNKQLDQQARNTDSAWNSRKRTQTQVDNPIQPKILRPGVPLSAHPNSKPSRDNHRQPQPLRAYQDMRKKFITDKLFSPVLRSQHSSQASASFEPSILMQNKDNLTAKTNDDQHHLTSLDERDDRQSDMMQVPSDHLVQGVLRPRQTRTAEGYSRPRINQNDEIQPHVQHHNEGSRRKDGQDQSDRPISTILTPQDGDLSHFNEKPIPVTQWLAQNSSFDGRSDEIKTIQSQSMAMINKDVQQTDYQNQARRSLNDRSAPTVGQKTQVTSQVKLCSDSQDTFNQVSSAHNIQEHARQQQNKSKELNNYGGTNASKDHLGSTQKLFEAPKQFNQISEASGDGLSDSGSKMNSKEEPMVQTQKLDGAFNIHLQGAEASIDDECSQKKSDDEGEQTEKDDQIGLIQEQQSESTLPQNYPRLL